MFILFDSVATTFVMVPTSALARIHLITLAQGKISGHVASFVIEDFLMFTYNDMSSNPASRMVWSLII